MKEIGGWFAGRIPDGWFEGPPEVTVDREEILVVGTIPDVDLKDGPPEALEAARSARVDRWREQTRDQRIEIAQEAQRKFRRKVSWGAEIAGNRRLFTHIAVPVMTRLRLSERMVLDTLLDAGVARSRSEALAWCVRLVGKNQSEWIDSLREALIGVEQARAEGPQA